MSAFIELPDLPPVLCPIAARRVRGDVCEEHVERVLSEMRLPWLLWTRHATPEEDREEGFDFVVYTRDVGRILLQIKSSEHGRIGWEEETRRYGRRYRIHVVLVRPYNPPEVILGRILAACILAREEALAARCVADYRGLYPHLRRAA